MKSPAYSIPARDEDSAGDTTRKRTPAFASVLLLELGGGISRKGNSISRAKSGTPRLAMKAPPKFRDVTLPFLPD